MAEFLGMQAKPKVLLGSMEFGSVTKQSYRESSWENVVLTVLHWLPQKAACPLGLFKKTTFTPVKVYAFWKSEPKYKSSKQSWWLASDFFIFKQIMQATIFLVENLKKTEAYRVKRNFNEDWPWNYYCE